MPSWQRGGEGGGGSSRELQSNTEALTFLVTHLRIPPPFSALFHVNGYTGQPQQTSCSPSVARYGRIFACLYAHHPMFEDLPLCVSGQRTCAELEYALRKYFPSGAPLSRPHLARHRRAWGAPAIFSADTFFRRFSHVWQGGA